MISSSTVNRIVRISSLLLCLGSSQQTVKVYGFSSSTIPVSTITSIPFSHKQFTYTALSSRSHSNIKLNLSSGVSDVPTELPDSLDDAAIIAAEASSNFFNERGPMSRCRIDFDTSVGDETYTTLKSSTEFMQKYVTALCYELIPGLQDIRQKEMMSFIQAKADLTQLLQQVGEENFDSDDKLSPEQREQKSNLMTIIKNGGRDASTLNWSGPKARIYFPDEGSAALARRDWKPKAENAQEACVPPCVEFSSCGGIQNQDTSKDVLIFFFCPRASEAEFVETTLYKCEDKLGDQLKLSVFVNPLLVDMGVTGFGLAGRYLRERLIDNLTNVYYLRTLPWGALTRTFPRQFTVWQEDADCEGGYRMIKNLNRLPSNPEVEDIYDYENGLAEDPETRQGFGLLNALGDFVQGMTRL